MELIWIDRIRSLCKGFLGRECHQLSVFKKKVQPFPAHHPLLVNMPHQRYPKTNWNFEDILMSDFMFLRFELFVQVIKILSLI